MHVPRPTYMLSYLVGGSFMHCQLFSLERSMKASLLQLLHPSFLNTRIFKFKNLEPA